MSKRLLFSGVQELYWLQRTSVLVLAHDFYMANYSRGEIYWPRGAEKQRTTFMHLRRWDLSIFPASIMSRAQDIIPRHHRWCRGTTAFDRAITSRDGPR